MFKTLEIFKSPEENLKVFEKHLESLFLKDKYQKVYLLNLLNQKKDHEKKLIQNYEYLVKKCQAKQ